MAGRVPATLSAISRSAPARLATAELAVGPAAAGFVEITDQLADFLAQSGAGDGLLLVFMRHTSASLTIQENADPAVLADLVAALHRLAPEQAPWTHRAEGPDDMPSHVKAMLTGVSLHVPVRAGRLALGTWQGIYVIEHRKKPRRRAIVLQFLGEIG